MNTKAVAAVIAGIIILSVVFFQFNVTYPTGPLNISPPPVTSHNVSKVKLGYLFSPQYAEPKEVQNMSFGTGMSSTNNFTFTQNGTTIIEGKLTNASSGHNINRTTLFVLASPLYTRTVVSAGGTYSIKTLVEGQMNLTFVVPGYQKDIVAVNLQGGTYPLNLILQPEFRIPWNGSTVSTTGNPLSYVVVKANGFFDGPQMFASSKKANFSTHLYSDYYTLTVNYAGYDSIPSPISVSLSAPLQQNVILTKKAYNFNLTGHVYSKVTRKGVMDARVYDQQTNMYTHTDSNGYYILGADYGMNRIVASDTGYFTNVSYYNESSLSFPVYDIYLEPMNPFLNNSTGSHGNTSKYPLLANNSSTLNPNNTGNFLLTGQITVNGTSTPISNTSFSFLVDINGTVYGDSVITNASGHYFANFNSAGHYSILVQSVLYENRVIDVTVSRNTTHYNFSLIPYANRTIHVTGYVVDKADMTPLGGATVTSVYVRDSLVASAVGTNRFGFFSMMLISGKFTISASMYGFTTNKTGVLDLTSNINLTIYLNPQKTLPIGASPTLIAAGKGPSYGLPDLSPSQIYSSMPNPGTVYSSSLYNLTMHLNNSFLQPISNTQFVIYVRANGQLYYFLGTTNSTGFSYIPGINAGLYNILAETFYYRGIVQTVNMTGNTTLWFTLTRNHVFNSTMYMQNVFNLTHALSGNVPGGPLDLTDSILPMSIAHRATINSTIFTFSGYNGTFNFTYLNKHFVQYSFSVVIAGKQKISTEGLNAFEIVVYGNTSSPCEYTISGTPFNVSLYRGISVHYNLEEVGQFNLTAWVTGFQVYRTTSISLTDKNPLHNIYFNQTSGSSNLSWKGGVPYGSYVRMLYSGPVPAGVFVYRGLLPYSTPSNISVYLNGTYVGVHVTQLTGQTSFTLDNYYLASVNLSAEIDIPPNSNGGFSGGTGNLEIYYYNISLK